MGDSEYITIPRASEIASEMAGIEIEDRQVRYWIDRGYLKARKIFGTIYVNRELFVEYVKSNIIDIN